MFELKNRFVISLNLAGNPRNPTGLAVWEDKAITACFAYTEEGFLEIITHNKTTLIAIDASLSLPKRGILRKSRERDDKKGL